MGNSYVAVPPDGAGKKIYSQQYTVGSDQVQVQGMHIVDPTDPTQIQKVDTKGAAYTRFSEGEPIMSPYNAIKTVEQYLVGVYEHTVDAYDDLFYINLVSGGTSTYDNQISTVKLTTTSNGGSKSERTTNRYHYYQQGVPLLIILAASCGDSGKANNVRQWGYFDDHNGLFFELNGTTLNLVVRSNVSGTEVDTKIPQSSWNNDKLDGTGISGINLDLTTTWQYFISFSWPSGQIRFGVYDGDGNRVVCHKISNSGSISSPTIRTLSLPIRYSNYNSSVTASGSDLNEIMAVVLAEGSPGYTYWRFSDLEVLGKTVNSSYTPVLSIRPKILLDNGSENIINTFPEQLSVFSSGASIKIDLVWFDDEPDMFTGATWDIDSIDGPLQGDSGATAINVDSNSYWQSITYYAPQDTPTNIDLRPVFELNDEGVLLGADSMSQNGLSFVVTLLNGSSANVSMTLTYRGLY